MPDFEIEPALAIAQRLQLRGEGSFSWFVVLTSSVTDSDILEDFCSDLKNLFNASPMIIDVTGLLADDVTAALQKDPSAVVLLVAIEQRSPEFWAALDINRSGLERPGAIIFWMSHQALGVMCTAAPNIRSYIGGSIYQLGPDGGIMTEGERSSRLKQLRNNYGLTDDELIRRAESHSLDPNPHFVEWLVLLGRGDLV
jgi:hypothetical protein